MPQQCPRCRRANPEQAVYCHHDGNLLRPGGDAAPPGQLAQEFVFPTGRRCRTYDDLVQGCYLEWEEARQLLHDGTFAGFLASQGRADLARVAREAQSTSDRDVALTNFIAALPAGHGHGPKLGLNPRRLAVGPLRVGETRSVQLRIQNDGQAMLQGKVTVAERAAWLKVAGGDDEAALAVRTPREQVADLRVDTTGLVVGQNYSARLVVVTNGGVAEVPVRLDLVARPFTRPPYTGAVNPRDLARRMRDAPTPAVALLEGGEVARWFAANGWSYPVVGGTAPGLASVQQFFEELGLAKAPAVSLSDLEVRLRCALPDVPTGQVTLRCAARKLVYARAESDSPWLRATSALVSGQMQATIGFTIDPDAMPEDRTYEGALRVIANAGQSFTVRVLVEVSGNRRGWFAQRPAPVPAVTAPGPVPGATSGPGVPAAPLWRPAPPRPQPSPPAPAPSSPPTLPVLVPVPAPPVARVGGISPPHGLLVGGLLGLFLRGLLVVPADLYARLVSGAGQGNAAALEAWLQAPPADEGFLRLFVLATWWAGPLLSTWLVWRRGGRWTDLGCGVLAGAVAGLAGSATLGCLLVAGDDLPRMGLTHLLGGRVMAPALATALWLLAALTAWAVYGAVLGLTLTLSGRAGHGLLARAARPVSALVRLCGWTTVADFFTLDG